MISRAQSLRDLRAGLGLRVGCDGVLQVEEHLIGGQILCLLDHLGVAARNRKATSTGPIRSPKSIIHSPTLYSLQTWRQ